MPVAAPRPCTAPGCHALVRDGSGRCSAHPRPQWAKRVDAPKRVTGRRLQRMREDLMRRDPLCVECRKVGIVRLWTQRDHILSLTEGGTDDPSNEQGLCDDHHREKTLAEALRARGVGGVESSEPTDRKPIVKGFVRAREFQRGGIPPDDRA